MRLDGFGQARQGHDRVCCAAFLYELMMTYGAPFEIISDRGKSFLAEGIDLLNFHGKRDRWDEYLASSSIEHFGLEHMR
ncbi:hypothetical protein BASA81_005689 [Batrachochytrium salamandrivorans]|nr:hypothetical protein BASA81_005689 [Batrachochytrium salamandrivorans]